jgi:putative transposase
VAALTMARASSFFPRAILAQFQIGKQQKISCLWVAAAPSALRYSCESSSGFQPLRVHSMAAPRRGNTGYSCYFITASTFQKRNILQSDRMARLFVNVLLHYRQQEKYLLHEFVVMPDHFHLLITPVQALERSMQLIKGGFSYRAKKELDFAHGIWQPSYYDRRVRDWEEYFSFREYIRHNPVKRSLGQSPEQYPYSSAAQGLELDKATQRLKPVDFKSA